MDYTGLVSRFPNDRPLTDFDKQYHLKQKVRLDVPLLAQLCVVKMDSNHLVSVDRWYGWRGFIALVGGLIVLLALAGLYVSVEPLFGDFSTENGLWGMLVFGVVAFSGLAGLGIWMAGKELFRWTYYPIVLDRKRRQVHVFRLNGTVLTAPWDKVYFTLGRGVGAFGWLNWDIRGLILAEDGVTVKETFAFCIATGRVENAHSHWEFLRRYMEEGPQAVLDAVLYCMPVDGKRESFAFSKERVFANDAGSPGFMYLTMIPFNYAHAIMRWAVMQTSKIPAFPPEIEAMLQPEPGDKYARDASMNPEDLR